MLTNGYFYRERLIHLLAVRPYKKPELLDRIHRGENVFLVFLFLIC